MASRSWVSRVTALAPALLALVALVVWRQPVPALADGSVCGGRVYSFGPGGGVPQGYGEVAPALRDASNAMCRNAAASLWWTGAALLGLAAVLGGAVLIQARREVRRQGDPTGADSRRGVSHGGT
jgi:hypothetical protein